MTRRSSAFPPRLAERLLRAVLPQGVAGASMVGDAREEYADYVSRQGRFPALWYWRHTLWMAGRYAVPAIGVRDMGVVFQELRFGMRALQRMPGSAVVSVLVLAMGIGLCSSMFSVIYGIYFRGMGLPGEDRLLVVWETNVARNQLQRGLPIQDLDDFRRRQTSFEGLLGYYSGTVNITADAPVRYQGAFVSANTFDLLHVAPAIGHTFREGDDAPGAPLQVVLGWDTWRNDYGRDPDIVGRTVRVNGELGTILGVMPAGFKWPINHQVWVPLRDDPLATERGQGRFATVFGRLKDDVSREQARMEVAAIADQLSQEYPDTNLGIGARVETPIESSANAALGLVFGAAMVAALCVLLVACANVANLLLARASLRHREAGIRLALGGSRLRVMMPFLAEALVLASVGAVIGIGFAYVGVDWFDSVTASSRTGRPYFMRFLIDGPILLFVVGVTVMTTLASGLAPAFQVSRTDVNSALKDGGRGSSSVHRSRLTRVLVTAEVALSCALLVGAGLMVKSILNLGHADYLYPTDQMFTARVGLFDAEYPDRESRQRFWADLEAELNSQPGIASASLTSSLPQGGAGQTTIAIEGVEYADARHRPSVNRVIVSTGFFDTLGVPIVGRRFEVTDDQDSEGLALVNQPMVDRYFDGQNPVGRRFRAGTGPNGQLLTVAGVVPDLQIQGGLPPTSPGYEPAGYYVPLRQSDPASLSIAAIPRGTDALAITADVRAAVGALDSDVPIYGVRTQAEVVETAVWGFAVFGRVFIVFGVSALLMASVGLYGVLSFAVSRRTQEMGIRMALGAGEGEVVRLVVRQGATQLGIGLLIGLGLAFGVTRVIGFLMFEVNPHDPVVFALVVGTIIVVGIAAAIFPAWRATNVNPVVALRAE